MLGWKKHKLESKFPAEILITSDNTTLMAESKEELKSLLKVKEKSEKVGLKLNIQKTKIMESGPITPWEIDGKTVETVSDFIFLGSKITAAVIAAMKLKDAYSTILEWFLSYIDMNQPWIYMYSPPQKKNNKRCLLLGRKVMTNFHMTA